MEAGEQSKALQPETWAATETCIVCGSDAFQPGYGPQTLVTCECCLDKGVHIECWQSRSGELLTEERLEQPGFEWFCSEGCRRVSERLVELTGVPQPLEAAGSGAAGEYSLELTRWSQVDRACQTAVGHAKKIFNSSFAPLIMGNGRNLIDMVCEAYESPDGGEPLPPKPPKQQQQQQEQQGGRGRGRGRRCGRGRGGRGGRGKGRGRTAAAAAAAEDRHAEVNDAVKDGNQMDVDGLGSEDEDEPEIFNFSTFRVLLLRKRGNVVSAAAMRTFGTKFAEVPFVATKEGYRREGHCRRLIQALEGILHGMGVQWIIVPGMKQVLPMWTSHFDYTLIGEEECAVLEKRVVMPDPSSASLVRKLLAESAGAAAAAAASGGGRGRCAKEQSKPTNRVRFNIPSYAEMSDEDTESEGAGRRGRKGGKRGGRQKAAKEEGSDYEMSDDDEEEDEDEALTGLVAEGEEACARCSTCEVPPGGWNMSYVTEERLCDGCMTPADWPAEGEEPGGTADGTGASKAGACVTCGDPGAVRRRKSGLIECEACSRYRSSRGAACPESVWSRRKKREGSRAASKPRGRTAAPSTPAPGSGSSAVAATTPQPATQQAQRGQQAQQAQRGGGGEEGEVPGREASMRHARRVEAALPAFAKCAGLTEGVFAEQLVADRLAGGLERLVAEAEEGATQALHEYEQQVAQLQAELARERQERRAEAAAAAQGQQQLRGELERARQAAEAERQQRQQLEAQVAALLEERQQHKAALRSNLAFFEWALQFALPAGHGAAPSGGTSPAAAGAAAAVAAAAWRSEDRGGGASQSAAPVDMATTADVDDEGRACFSSEAAEPAVHAVGGDLPSAAGTAGPGAAAVGPFSLPVACAPSPAFQAAAAGQNLRSPDASSGGKGSGRRRLTSGRASGGSGAVRRRVIRSRPVLQASPSSAGALPSFKPTAEQQQQQQPAPQLGTDQAAGSGSGGGRGSAAASEDWGAGLFGIFGAVAGGDGEDGAAVADNSQLPRVPAPISSGLGMRDELQPCDGPASSPGTSLDAVEFNAGAHADGGRRPSRAAAIRLALGSQESCSQGAGAGRLPPHRLIGAGGGSIAQGGTFGGPTPAPSPAFGALPPAEEAEAGLAAAAASQLERLQLDQRVARGAAGAAAAEQQQVNGHSLAEPGDTDVAMRTAGQLADDLEDVLMVGAGKQYATISAALERASNGATLVVSGGRYSERLVITRPVTIQAAPGDAVELIWQSNEPYQSTIEVDASAYPALAEPSAVVLQGLRVRHSSPSIANNYGIRLVDCGAILQDCDISSSSGDGIGIEGGAPRVQRCSVHDCARQGVAVFGDLFGGGCAAELDGCSLANNRLNGLLVRDGARPAVDGCSLTGNGEWGLRLQDAGGTYNGNVVAANAKGSVAYTLLDDEVDTALMVVYNKLDRPVQSVGKM